MDQGRSGRAKRVSENIKQFQ